MSDYPTYDRDKDPMLAGGNGGYGSMSTDWRDDLCVDLRTQLEAARERINELENAVLPQEYCDPFSFVLRQLRDQRVAIQRLIEMLESLKPSTPAPDMK